MEAGKRYCSKCGKIMTEINFFKLPNGERSNLCKTCETLHVNNYDPSTFMFLLEKYDVPFLPWRWNEIRDKEYNKNPLKFGPKSVFGKYLQLMKLVQYKKYGYSDSEALQKEYERQVKSAEDEKTDVVKAMEESFENGEITESYLNNFKAQIEKENAEKAAHEEHVAFMAAGGVPTLTQEPSAQPFPAEELPVFEQVDIPSLGDELTAEDKIYLATKWGRLYSADDWIYLERKYNDFVETFDIQGAARIDTLIQICKLSLKANNALDSGDVDGYSKLTRSYDALMKSAKFTEAQKREEKAEDFDSIGAIVAFAEKEGGIIPRRDLGIPQDVIDESIDNLKRYNRELILNDPSLARQLEDYINRRNAIEKAERERKEAIENGEGYVILEDKDFIEHEEMIEEETNKDVARNNTETSTKTES